MNQRILISGASIAGLTAAHWLARYGFDVTVVERAHALREGGNGVDIRGHAADVVERMGLTERIRGAATDVRGMKFVDDDDRALAFVDTAGASEVEIMRGDLSALLHEAAGEGVEYLFADSIKSLDQDEHGVTVAFERAGIRRFDLVVGADGLHSNTRRLAFGPEEEYLRFKDHYFAFANADAALGEDRRVTMHNRPGRMTGVYRSGNHAQAKAYFMFRSKARPYDHRDGAAQRAILAEAFAGDNTWHTRELLATALADPDLYFDALAQVDMPSWHNGRVVLIGDAAWCASPASGAGAELAIVGAYRLAGELAAAGGDHRTAFAAFESAHRDLVRDRQKIGPNIRLMVPKSECGAKVRNVIAKSPVMALLGSMEAKAEAKRRRPLREYEVAR